VKSVQRVFYLFSISYELQTYRKLFDYFVALKKDLGNINILVWCRLFPIFYPPIYLEKNTVLELSKDNTPGHALSGQSSSNQHECKFSLPVIAAPPEGILSQPQKSRFSGYVNVP
jgi:hypothetical protein